MKRLAHPREVPQSLRRQVLPHQRIFLFFNKAAGRAINKMLQNRRNGISLVQPVI
jgi:hypothetical protein